MSVRGGEWWSLLGSYIGHAYHGHSEAWSMFFHSTACMLEISQSGGQQGCFSFSLSFL